VSGGAVVGGGIIRFEPSGPLTRIHGTEVGGFGRGGFWAAVEAQPLCDFSLGLMFSLSAVANGGPSVDPTTEAAWSIHVGYEPNVLCRRQRAGLYKIQSESAAAAPPASPPAPPPPEAPSPAPGG
jgi:hypothetical protein